LPPVKYFLFWGSEYITYNGRGRGSIDRVYRGSLLLGHRLAGKDQRRLALWWWTDRFEPYWRLHARSCDLIGHLASPWRPKGNHNG
jgi:hypothetical protein